MRQLGTGRPYCRQRSRRCAAALQQRVRAGDETPASWCNGRARRRVAARAAPKVAQRSGHCRQQAIAAVDVAGSAPTIDDGDAQVVARRRGQGQHGAPDASPTIRIKLGALGNGRAHQAASLVEGWAQSAQRLPTTVQAPAAGAAYGAGGPACFVLGKLAIDAQRSSLPSRSALQRDPGSAKGMTPGSAPCVPRRMRRKCQSSGPWPSPARCTDPAGHHRGGHPG